jgi:hypothetical protein
MLMRLIFWSAACIRESGNREKASKKIKGIPVLTTTTMTMMKNTTVKSSRELLEIKEGTAPSGIFGIPIGYTKQTMPQGMGGGMRPGKQKPE